MSLSEPQRPAQSRRPSSKHHAKPNHGANGADHGLASRPPPHSLEAEQAVLGAILLDNDVHGRVADFLHPEHFFDRLHGQVYEAASKLIASGQRADPITLRPFFETAEPIDAKTTVPVYLGTLATNVPTIANASEYARTVKDLATSRRLILIGEDIVHAAHEARVGFSPGQQIAEHQQRLSALDSGSRLAAVSVASFAGQPTPPREWHAKGLIPAKNITLLGGDGATGKSLLAAQLAAATVLGRSWLAADVKRGPVVYLGAEDDLEEMHRRFADIAREQGVELDRLGSIHICCLAGKDAVLATANERGAIEATDLWHEFRRLVISLKPSLVVYDTLADLFAGNENSRAQTQQFVTLPRGLALETDSTALLLAHPSLSGMASGSGLSGSTAWSNSVRSRLYLDRVRDEGIEPDPDARVLRTMKANYGPSGGEIRLRWRDGAFAVVGAEGSSEPPLPSAKDIQAEALFLELLKIYSDTDRHVAATTGANYAPAKFANEDRAKAAGIGKKVLERAMGRLLEAKRIQVHEYGPQSRRQKRLEVA